MKRVHDADEPVSSHTKSQIVVQHFSTRFLTRELMLSEHGVSYDSAKVSNLFARLKLFSLHSLHSLRLNSFILRDTLVCIVFIDLLKIMINY